ncbi:hypothetical protein [Halomonas sp.]|uniref:hypothetical protein n=1 Tax=Halomonas sp. TaxID=1486246 RepID=UPI0035660F98
MANVTELHPTPAPAFRYKAGDITRALAEGLRHEAVADDVEAVLSGLLFSPDEHAIDSARELLADLLEAYRATRLQSASKAPASTADR